MTETESVLFAYGFDGRIYKKSP